MFLVDVLRNGDSTNKKILTAEICFFILRPLKFHLSCFRSSERADDALQRREERAERPNRRHSAAQHRRAGRRLVHERHSPPAESPPAESRNP
jgi:hypothetical protein